MSKQDMSLVIGMSRVLGHINLSSSRLLDPFGLTLGQFAVLEALYSKGPLSVGQVQRKILTSSGTIPVILTNLENEALIIRTRDQEDKRRVTLDLTDKGRTLISEVFELNRQLIEEKVSCWTKEERTTLLRLLKKFGDHYEL